MRAGYLVPAIVVMTYTVEAAQDTMLVRLHVTGTDAACIDVPLCATIDVPLWLRAAPPTLLYIPMNEDGETRTDGTILVSRDGKGQLWWIAPQVKAHSSNVWTAEIHNANYLVRHRGDRDIYFGWTTHSRTGERGFFDLLYDRIEVVRYAYGHDPCSPGGYKPFYHVYDGRQRLTNGPDGVRPYPGSEVVRPEDRGIFIGWSKLTFEGKTYDFWHMKGAAQTTVQLDGKTAGSFMGKCTSTIQWDDSTRQPILLEERQVTVYRLKDPATMLLDLKSALQAVRGDVFLDGDPEQGGVQYRAHNGVAVGPKEGKAQYLFHRDGTDPRTEGDLPWVAMSYGLSGKRYCVQQMNHPGNPKGTIWSADSDYGRFGTFFKETIKKDQTLTLRYRFWIGRGDTPAREALASRYSAYANPPKVEVVDVQVPSAWMESASPRRSPK